MTLGEMSAVDLLRSASREMMGLNSAIEALDRVSQKDKTLLGAYVGSIWARIVVAHSKIEEAERKLTDDNLIEVTS